MSIDNAGARLRAKRVVLLSSGSLLAAGVERLLGAECGLDICVVAEHDPEIAAKLRRLAPSVIVVDSGKIATAEGVITRILQEHPQAKVIALNLNRTDIEVYRMERLVQADTQGLLEAIQGKRASAQESFRNIQKKPGRRTTNEKKTRHQEGG